MPLFSTSGVNPSLRTKPGEDLMAQVWFGSKSQPIENCQLNGDSEARQKSHKFPSSGNEMLHGTRESGTVWKNISSSSEIYLVVKMSWAPPSRKATQVR